MKITKFKNFEDIPHYLLKAYYKYRHKKRDIMTKKKWDNMIILDACRYDVFKTFNNIPGSLTKIYSAGSNTKEWYINNFLGKNFKNIIYVSANPQISNFMLKKRYGNNPFYKVIDVWKEEWSEKLGTVHPEKVNKITSNSLKTYPEKKYIIHYLQPHYPFIGEIKLKSEVMNSLRQGVLNKKTKREWEIKTPWDLVKEGLIDLCQISRAYISNLKFVLKTVTKLLPLLNGKTIITSDHGNSFGKFGIFYGHPMGFSLPELIEVPWLEVKLT